MVPIGFAIAVYGTIFGVVARPAVGPWGAVAMSALVFSGALQFTAVALAATGVGLAAILLAVCGLNARHVLLGAILRPRVGGSTLRRALLSWFLVDESFGLAMTSPADAGRPLLLSGAIAYVLWLLGTGVGVLGANLQALQGPAEAAFPVLFIGLTALVCTSRSLLARAIISGAACAAIAVLWPGLQGLAPVLIAIVVGLAGKR
jgi:predicted branched-subunit amino acid permease